MEEISINQIAPGQFFDKTVSLGSDYLLLYPDMKITEQDIEMLREWRVKSVFLTVEKEEAEESGSGDFYERYLEEKKLYSDIISNSTKELVKLYEEISRRGNSSVKRINEIGEECLSVLRRNVDFLNAALIFYLPNKSSPENDAFKTAIYSLVIGLQLKLPDEKLKELFVCALLINIGMLRMQHLTRKVDKLTPSEIQQIQSHPIAGFTIVKDKMKLGNLVSLVVLTHHENMDGSGYPRRLKSDKIPLYSKIIAVAEEFVALCCEKPYRKNFSLYDAMKTLISDGKKKFDQTVVSCLLANLSLYPVGSVVQMNDGQVGLIASPNPKVPLRPKVLLMLDSKGMELSEKIVIDLVNSQSSFIKVAVTDEVIVGKVYKFFK